MLGVARTWSSPPLLTWYLLHFFLVKSNSPTFWASIFNSLKWGCHLPASLGLDAHENLAVPHLVSAQSTVLIYN